ncbi:hypothetical protein P618_200167 [Holospora obtusa F1]|uniref:Uncharacterized protein n=1 Tax=Holospora obtusa F1 TaxID=1399147 RepID=W6TEG1_HOLOB|nr:hypothetical protein [Holospora obtusa]ETZ07628.1 hypothetical protein P618_200167 [Holospora obtusa F1]
MNKLFYKLFFISFMWLNNSFAPPPTDNVQKAKDDAPLFSTSFKNFLEGPVRRYIYAAHNAFPQRDILYDSTYNQMRENIVKQFLLLSAEEKELFFNYLKPDFNKFISTKDYIRIQNHIKEEDNFLPVDNFFAVYKLFELLGKKYLNI